MSLHLKPQLPPAELPPYTLMVFLVGVMFNLTIGLPPQAPEFCKLMKVKSR